MNRPSLHLQVDDMSKLSLQQRNKEKRKLAEKALRMSKRRWKYTSIFVLVYLLSIIPYAFDLARQPNLWNGLLFLALSIGGVAAIILVVKHERF
jgi:cytochrome bd-type quinol oxidase subunit 2